MLELSRLKKGFPQVQVLAGFSLRLPERGVVALMGPSGCGKTTLFLLIARLLKPDGGSIRAPEKCSLVFQEDRLLPWSSVGENIALVLNNPWRQGHVVASLLQELGLEGTENLPIQELSGGMQRRVALARALAYDAPLLLLDEPFKGLDAATKEGVMDIIAREGEKKLVLLNTHQAAEAAALAQRVFLLAGPPLEIVKEVVIAESYKARRDNPSLAAPYRRQIEVLSRA